MKAKTIMKIYLVTVLVLCGVVFSLLEIFFVKMSFHCIELYSMGQKIYLGLVILSWFYAIFIPIGIVYTVIYRKYISIFFENLLDGIREAFGF